MRKITFLFLFLIATMSYGQNWDFGLVQNSGYTFDVVAVPNFSGAVDASDAGFTLTAQIGNSITVDTASLVDGEGIGWGATAVPAATLTSVGVGDGTKDAYLFSRSPQQILFTATAGTPATMVTFNVTGSPTSGILELAANTDPIVVGLEGLGFGGNSFYNADTGSGTNEYFQTRVSGQELFDFSLLSNPDAELTGISMYPNPANNDFVVKGLDLESNITIHDMNGKLVMTKESYTGDAINVAQLQAGIYFVNISNDNGSATKKLIVE